MVLVLRIFVLLLLCSTTVSGLCPQNCSCGNEYQLAVNCNNVKLQYIPSLLHPGTQSLKLSKCGIEKLESDVMELYPDLIQLDLSSNNISDLGNNVFRYQGKIQFLNLSDNNFHTIFRDSFQGLNELQNLDLSASKIQKIESSALEHLANLVELDLSHNLFHNISFATFAGLTNLQSLTITGNKITHLNGTLSATLPNLRRIDLSQNLIITIPSDTFYQSNLIKTIDLSTNFLKYIPNFDQNDLANLEYLNMSFNKLDKIEPHNFRELRSLLVLDLTGNELTVLSTSAFDGLFRLKVLGLAKQRLLKEIRGGSFSGLASLEELNLSCNPVLEYIDENAFEVSPVLNTFDVRFCALKTLPFTLFDWKRVPELYLNDNPFHCDQKLLSFLPNVLRLRSIDDVVCSTPAELHNVSISSLYAVDATAEDTKRALIVVSSTLTVLTIIVVLLLFLYPKLIQMRHQNRKSRAPPIEQRLYQNLLHKSEYILPECYNSASEFSSSSTCASQNTFVDLFRSKSYYDRIPHKIPTDVVLINDDVFVKQADFTYLCTR